MQLALFLKELKVLFAVWTDRPRQTTRGRFTHRFYSSVSGQLASSAATPSATSGLFWSREKFKEIVIVMLCGILIKRIMKPNKFEGITARNFKIHGVP